jgi:hypothetical protein
VAEAEVAMAAADTDAADTDAVMAEAEALASMVLRLSWRPVPAAGGTLTAGASAGIDIDPIAVA